ncbi:unnamed protein product, partial [Ectocarpus sp. 12 AP-2014]
MDLLDRPLYTMSGPDLDELLQLIEVLVAPLANLKETPPPAVEEAAGGAAAAAAAAGGGGGTGESGSPAVEEESKMEVDSPLPPAAAGRPAGAGAATVTSEKYEWVKVPAPVVQHERLRLLCSVLRLEACSDNSFQRVGTVVSNLSKVPENRMTLLKELVSVAKSLGAVSTHDLQSLEQQLDVAKRDAMAR